MLDWEADFLSMWFDKILSVAPKLKIVLEHISTGAGVAAVKQAGPNVAGTITAHHLLYTIDAVLAHGIRPRHYCKPIAKQWRDREALRDAAFSGNSKFFLGSDSAPHTIENKYKDWRLRWRVHGPPFARAADARG